MNSTPIQPPMSDEHEDARVLEIEAEKDQRGQREDDSRSNGLAGVARGLNDIVFKDGGAAKGAQNADGKHRDGDGCGDRETGAQAHVDRDRAKNQAEERAEKNRAERELGRGFFRWNKRSKGGGCVSDTIASG